MKKFLNILMSCVLLFSTVFGAFSSLAAESTISADVSASGPGADGEGYREESADDMEVLSYLSCESAFIAETFKYGNTYTCTEEPLLNQIVTAILTAGMSVTLLIRLKMKHPDLFPNGNCERSKRVEYYDQKMTYYECSNFKIIQAIGSAVLQAFVNIVTSGSWDFPNPAVADYHYKHRDKGPGYTKVRYDLSAFYVSKVVRRQDKLCVSILAATGTYLPVGCKYIKEPFPKSIYEMNSEDSEYQGPEGCDSAYTCAKYARIHSRTFTPVISPIVNCIKDMLVRLVVSKDVCDPMNVDGYTNMQLAKAVAAGMKNGSLINDFQTKMHNIVTAFLTLYVFFFGIRIATGATQFKPIEFFNFAVKIILVTYFSIGINMTSSTGAMRFDGMTQIAFPFIFQGMAEISSWFMVASNINGMCEFPNDIYDPKAPANMALWDQIDCRLAKYLGYDSLMQSINYSGDDPVQNNMPPYVFLLIPAILIGNLQFAMFVLSYPIMIMSFVAYAIALFCSSLIYITILGMLAPVFVPMVLFEQTKAYFMNWWQTMLAMLLQPVIAITFMTLMFAVYDRGFYGTCQYKSIDIQFTEDGESKIHRDFFISVDPADYRDEQDLIDCKLSMAYFFSNPFSALFGSLGSPDMDWMDVRNGGKGTATKTYTINKRDPKIYESIPDSEEEYLQGENKPSFEYSKGIFTSSPKVFWQTMVNVFKNFVVCFIILAVLKNLMNSISAFIIGLSGSQFDASGAINSGTIQRNITSKAQSGLNTIEEFLGPIRQKIMGGLGNANNKKDGDKKDGDKKDGDKNDAVEGQDESEERG